MYTEYYKNHMIIIRKRLGKSCFHETSSTNIFRNDSNEFITVTSQTKPNDH